MSSLIKRPNQAVANFPKRITPRAYPFTQFTQCPQCLTIFGIKTSQLIQLQGTVRCGNCFKIFAADKSLVLPPKSALAFIAPQKKKTKTRLNLNQQPTTKQTYHPRKTLLKHQKNTEDSTTIPTYIIKLAENLNPVQHRIFPLLFTFKKANKNLISNDAQASKQTHSKQPFIMYWALGTLLFIFLWCGQYVWFNRNTLANYPELYPWLTKMCNLLPCQLAAFSDPDQIQVIARDLSNHPTLKDELRLHAIISNNAKLEQSYPTLSLNFTDINGKLITSNIFQPKDYLSGTTLLEVMPIGIPIHLVIDLSDPGHEATGFSLTFEQ